MPGMNNNHPAMNQMPPNFNDKSESKLGFISLHLQSASWRA